MERVGLKHGLQRAGLVAATAAALAALASISGCTGALTTAGYLMGAHEVKAKYNGFRDKRVAVVCRPLVELHYRNSTAGKELARQIGGQLRSNVRRCEVVDYRRVDEWVDENTWNEYLEVGRALNADLVLGIDLEHFDIYQGQTLYQGKAFATIRVFDCESGELVFEDYVESVFPRNSAVPTADMAESQFRRRYVGVLADQVARLFYAHEPHVNFAQDATIIR